MPDCETCRRRYAQVPNLPDCDDPNGAMRRSCPRAKLKDAPEEVQSAFALASLCLQLHCLPEEGGLLNQDLLFLLAVVEYKRAETVIQAQELERARARMPRARL